MMSIHFTPILIFLLKEEGVSQRSPRERVQERSLSNYLHVSIGAIKHLQASP